MLTQLSIKNIVLIEQAELSFGESLCVLSGETGAGKSILLDALGLVLGGRSDAGLVRQGQAQASVSAAFDVSENALVRTLLAEIDLPNEETLILRRTLGSDGKSKCFVNDQPVTVAALKKLGESLVEIHGQHDQRTLQDSALHRDLLDEYGVSAALLSAVKKAYETWRQAKQSLVALRAELEQAAREEEYLLHMRNELNKLKPEIGEETTLADERMRMMQFEKLYTVLNEALAELASGKGVASQLLSAQRTLTRSPFAQSFAPVVDALEKAAVEAQEATEQLEKIGRDSVFNPEQLDQVEERLFALKAAGRKYHVPVDELAALLATTDQKLQNLNQQAKQTSVLEKLVREAQVEFEKQAALLTEARKKSAAKLEKAITKELAPLKMENTHFRVRVTSLPEENWAAHGADEIRFECATNVAKGEKEVVFAPLSKIASGGELSRFMLALKVALSSQRTSGTLIFDEIDAGTGGAVADAIGKRLQKLGEAAQVLVVTHLPQVAARGAQHLLIRKQTKAGKITTEVTQLSRKSREEELARMLSGAQVTGEALKAAQKLLEQAA